VRHPGRGLALEQDGFAIRMLDLVGAQVKVESAAFSAEAGRDPSGQQIDRYDDAIATIAMENNGSWSNGFH
jgi:hypothetical protein